jgi:uridine kinase
MKLLKESFRLNGLRHTQLKRNEVVALYGVGGTYTNMISHWVVCKIYHRKDKYGEREALPTNEQFGRDLSWCFNNYKSALRYFDELTTRYKLLQGVPKVVTGVQSNTEVIPEHQSLAA